MPKRSASSAISFAEAGIARRGIERVGEAALGGGARHELGDAHRARGAHGVRLKRALAPDQPGEEIDRQAFGRGRGFDDPAGASRARCRSPVRRGRRGARRRAARKGRARRRRASRAAPCRSPPASKPGPAEPPTRTDLALSPPHAESFFKPGNDKFSDLLPAGPDDDRMVPAVERPKVGYRPALSIARVSVVS